MVVKEIFSIKHCEHKCDDIFLKANIFSEILNFFKYPLSSKEIGLYNVTKLAEVKCILTFQNETIVTTLISGIKYAKYNEI